MKIVPFPIFIKASFFNSSFNLNYFAKSLGISQVCLNGMSIEFHDKSMKVARKGDKCFCHHYNATS